MNAKTSVIFGYDRDVFHYKNEACKRLHQQGEMSFDKSTHRVPIFKGFASRYVKCLRNKKYD